jgi:hypothetical protein
MLFPSSLLESPAGKPSHAVTMKVAVGSYSSYVCLLDLVAMAHGHVLLAVRRHGAGCWRHCRCSPHPFTEH